MGTNTVYACMLFAKSLPHSIGMTYAACLQKPRFLFNQLAALPEHEVHRTTHACMH
jgi:hypothetical protein